MSTFLYGAHVHANGIRQHYLRFGGKGRTLIVVPGITSPAITWAFVGERLGEIFDTYIFDARGRGLSSSGPSLDYGLEALAADLGAALHALDVSNAFLLGHSMGARIAVRACARHNLQADRIILVDPPVTGPGRRHYPAPLSWYVDSIRLATEGCEIEDMRKFLPAWHEDHLRLRAEWLHTCDEQAIIRSYNDFHETDIHADLQLLTAPTLLMVAGKGGVILPEDAEEILQLLPRGTAITVPNTGHMIPWDDFEGFFGATLSFFCR